MTTLENLKRVCDSIDGYAGEPGHDNNNRFWAELDPGLQGNPYCAVGLSWIWKHAGHALPAVDHSFGFTYCPDGVNYAKRNGLWSASGHYAPGDAVFYDWDGDGVSDHVGLVIADDGTTIHTFACNESDRCGYFSHPHGPHVLGVWQTSRYLTAAPHPAPAPAPPKHHVNPFRPPHLPPNIHRDDHANPSDRVRYVQWAVGVPVDGRFGPQTLGGVRQFQHYHRDNHGRRLDVDGIVGPLTLGALERVYH